MPESAQHAQLVRSIVKFVEKNIGDLSEIAVWEDAIDSRHGERPPLCSGFRPDVYATNVPTTMTVIGEAKTAADLETGHSHEQLSAFLSHLAHTEDGLLVLAVPIASKSRAKTILRNLGATLGSNIPNYVVIDELSNPAE